MIVLSVLDKYETFFTELNFYSFDNINIPKLLKIIKNLKGNIN